MWKSAGNAGINLLNVIPKLGNTVGKFFGNVFTDVFNSIYNQQIDHNSARKVIISFFIIAEFLQQFFADIVHTRILMLLKLK